MAEAIPAEQIAQWRSQHWPLRDEGFTEKYGNQCGNCAEDWPCAVVQLIDALSAAREAGDG